MIVNCPACQTRFRYASDGTAALIGRCSRCEESVALQPMKRQYVILRGTDGSAGRRVAIGLDDPLLAPKLQAAQSRVAAAAAGSEAAFDLPPLPSGIADPFGLEPTSPREPEAPAVTPSAAARTPRVSAPTHPALIVALCTAAGAAAGYHGATWQQVDPALWAVIGSVAGLAMGWAWTRWVKRRN